MCGFIGKVSSEDFDFHDIEKNNAKIICRGPDNTTKFTSSQKKINFSSKKYFNFIFNRLSIVDLSDSANQPMYSDKYNTSILFNGEIFNHSQLRQQMFLDGIKFNTKTSDTETLLMGLSVYGLKFVEQINGQFSIVFIDYKNEKISLIRDRLGQKPLFYTYTDEYLEFSSNLESLQKIEKTASVDEEQIFNYLQKGVISSPKTIFKNIYKVEPAQVLVFDLEQKVKIINQYKYWEIGSFVNSQEFNSHEFLEVFTDSVKLRSKADVQIGTFLSGGIDSTAIIKKLVELGKEIKSFSVKFTNNNYDESKWFKQVVKKYNISNEIVEVNSSIDNKYIEKIINDLDEPYADPSLVPTYKISELIAKKYKVAISGDGGDELLGGYKHLNDLLNRKKLHEKLVCSLFKIYPSNFGSGTEILSRSKNTKIAYSTYFNDYKLMEALNLKSKIDKKTYFNFVNKNLKKSIQLADYKFYLSEMMLLKIDRASMANSLEVRSPFLDHRLVEYVLGHEENNEKQTTQKMLLKQYLSNDFDDNFLHRKKMGFSFDVENWVDNNLDYIQDTISNGKFIKNYNINILKKLTKRNTPMNGQRIWKIFVLEKYLSKF